MLIISQISDLKHIFPGSLTGAFITWVGIPCFNKLISGENTFEDISKKYVLVLDDFGDKDVRINDDDSDIVNITKTKDGYSIDGGKTTAFKNTEISKGSDKPYPRTYEGASFATPRVLVSDLRLYK